MTPQQASQLGVQAVKNKAKARAQEIEMKARLINPDLSLDYSTYTNTRVACRWNDGNYGQFWRAPLSVLQQKAAFHPDHVRERNHHSGTFAKAAAASRQALFEKYGVFNPSQIPGTQEKVAQTRRKNGTDRTSGAEEKFGAWLKAQGLNAHRLQLAHNGRTYLIDFLIEGSKLCIEYNGDFWHSSGNSKMTPRYHKEKMLACQAAGLQLIHVFDSEWKTNQGRISRYILSKVKPAQDKVNARDCSVVTLPDGGKQFFKDNHIQGWVPGTCLALVSEDGTVQCALILGSHHRKQTGPTVLRRFASRKDTRVRGGLSKLSKYARCHFGPLLTWVDLRWSTPDSYQAAGWKIDAVLKPDYWYWDDRKKCTVSKQARKKSAVNTPPGMTEFEHAKQEKLWRIYDCGKVRLRLD